MRIYIICRNQREDDLDPGDIVLESKWVDADPQPIEPDLKWVDVDP